MTEFEEAVERIVAGLEKKNRLINPSERETVAYHEMGHALVALSLPGTDPVQKISIIPRGIAALGYTMQVPTEDRFLMRKTELENKIASLLGGRAAEEIIFGDISTGAHNDLARATDIARSMVREYGMSEKLGRSISPATSSPSSWRWAPRRPAITARRPPRSSTWRSKRSSTANTGRPNRFSRAIGMSSKREPRSCCRRKRSRGRNSWPSWRGRRRRPPRRSRGTDTGLPWDRPPHPLEKSGRAEVKKSGKKQERGENFLQEEKKTSKNPVWSFFSSVRLTVALLIIIALAAVVGTVIPQQDAASEAVQKLPPALAGALKVLQLHDLYRSPWFLLLMGLLTVNLVVCSLNRLPASLRLYRRQPEPDRPGLYEELPPERVLAVEGNVEDEAARMEQVLKKALGSVERKGTDQATWLSGHKGAWSYFGVYVIHEAMEEGVVLALRDVAQQAGLHWDTLRSALQREGRLHLETY